jgi:hypothetical protein
MPSARTSKSTDLEASVKAVIKTSGVTRRVIRSLATGCGPMLVAENPSEWSHARGRAQVGGGSMGLVSIRAAQIIYPQHCWGRREPLVRMGLAGVEGESLW